MKSLRIVWSLMSMGLLWLSLPASAQFAPDAPMAVEPKATQGDTIRMTWTVGYPYGDYWDPSTKSFGFCGEPGAIYRVEWGDGETGTATGKGPDSRVECSHTYSQTGEYTVKLYGVAAAQKKKK